MSLFSSLSFIQLEQNDDILFHADDNENGLAEKRGGEYSAQIEREEKVVNMRRGDFFVPPNQWAREEKELSLFSSTVLPEKRVFWEFSLAIDVFKIFLYGVLFLQPFP